MLSDERVNVFTHLVGAVAMVPGTVFLVLRSQGIGMGLAVVVYGTAAIALFFFSSLYHFQKRGEREESIPRTLDHIGIFIMIAGTYTPICVAGLSGGWRISILSVQWFLVVAGTVINLIRLPIPRWVETVIYVAMGWVAIVAIRPLYLSLSSQTFIALAVGGVFYTIGAVVYGTKHPDPWPGIFGFHEIWHLFILAAAGVHYYMIWSALA